MPSYYIVSLYFYNHKSFNLDKQHSFIITDNKLIYIIQKLCMMLNNNTDDHMRITPYLESELDKEFKSCKTISSLDELKLLLDNNSSYDCLRDLLSENKELYEMIYN